MGTLLRRFVPNRVSTNDSRGSIVNESRTAVIRILDGNCNIIIDSCKEMI